MRVLAVIHHAVSGPGVFAGEAVARGHAFEQWEPADGPPPRSLSDYNAVMAFGGGMQVDEDERYPWLRTVLDLLREGVEREVPILGVCLGAQMLAHAVGGAVGPAPRAERGWSSVELTGAGRQDPLFAGEPRIFEVFQWHSDAFELPPGAIALAHSPVCLQAFRAGPRAWGVQWHPEVTAETVLDWARTHVPAPGGVDAPLDLAEFQAAVSARMEQTNHEGRALCRRFLQVAERAVVA